MRRPAGSRRRSSLRAFSCTSTARRRRPDIISAQSHALMTTNSGIKDAKRPRSILGAGLAGEPASRRGRDAGIARLRRGAARRVHAWRPSPTRGRRATSTGKALQSNAARHHRQCARLAKIRPVQRPAALTADRGSAARAVSPSHLSNTHKEKCRAHACESALRATVAYCRAHAESTGTTVEILSRPAVSTVALDAANALILETLFTFWACHSRDVRTKLLSVKGRRES